MRTVLQKGRNVALKRANPRKGRFKEEIGRKSIYKSLYAYAHAADPEYSLRQSTLRQLSFETPFCRPYLIEIPGRGGDPGEPRAPKGTQWDPRGGKGRPRGPKGTQGEPRGGDPRVPKGAKGTQGRLRRPWEGMGPWGHLGLFRSHFESKAISNGRLLRMGRHSEERANLKFARETTNCKNSYCKATYNGSENCGPKRVIS